MERGSFERLVAGLVRAGLVTSRQEEFEKEGKTLVWHKLSLTPSGRRAVTTGAAAVALPAALAAQGSKPRRRKKAATAPSSPARAHSPAAAPRGAQAAARGAPRPAPRLAAPASAQLAEDLRAFRLAEARAKRVPAFRILTDQVLSGIAERFPADEGALLDIAGVGPALVKKYGKRLLALVRARS
jgi:DNA topoisomerase-3